MTSTRRSCPQCGADAWSRAQPTSRVGAEAVCTPNAGFNGACGDQLNMLPEWCRLLQAESDMAGYLIRRTLLVIPTLFIVTLIVFFTIRLIPGDIITLTISELGGGIGNIDRERLEAMLGLDVPAHVQYVRWISNILTHGDLGNSLRWKTPITEEILRRIPVTFEVGLLALILSQLVAVPIGVYSALRQDTIADYVGRIFAIFGIAVPGFWLATMVMVYPSIWWSWSPPVLYVPFAEDPLENLKTVIVPAIVLGMSMSGVTMRMSRTMMLDVLRQDYVRTAWSKGLRERLVVFRHALKNALIPVITYIGLMIPILIGGQVVIEKIFALPGMGMLAVDALSYRDYTIVSGVNLFFAGFVLLVNLGVDLTYAWLDPRISYQTGRDAGSE